MYPELGTEFVNTIYRCSLADYLEYHSYDKYGHNNRMNPVSFAYGQRHGQHYEGDNEKGTLKV
jgi:hypothetical protein